MDVSFLNCENEKFLSTESVVITFPLSFGDIFFLYINKIFLYLFLEITIRVCSITIIETNCIFMKWNVIYLNTIVYFSVWTFFQAQYVHKTHTPSHFLAEKIMKSKISPKKKYLLFNRITNDRLSRSNRLPLRSGHHHHRRGRPSSIISNIYMSIAFDRKMGRYRTLTIVFWFFIIYRFVVCEVSSANE